MYWPFNGNFPYSLTNGALNYMQQEYSLYWQQSHQNQYYNNTLNSTMVKSNQNQISEFLTYKNSPSNKSSILKKELHIQQVIILKEQQESNQVQNKKQKNCYIDPKRIIDIIQFAVNNININDSQIQQKKKLLQQNRQQKLVEIFEILLKKFRKYHKTKEQIIKYCMRKAFKFISEIIKKDEAYDGKQCIKFLFSKYEQQKNFSIPFKKSSSIKSLNSSFLIKIFKSYKFTELYLQFLRQFKSISLEDNINKIFILQKCIQQSIHQNKIQNIQSLNRLPWTLEIINKSYQIAVQLLKFSPHQQRFKKQINPILKLEVEDQSYREKLVQKRVNTIPVKKQNKYKKRQKKLAIFYNSARFTRSKSKEMKIETKQIGKTE